MKSETFTFNSVPHSVEELKALPECDLSTPFKTCALAVLVCLNYANDKQATIDMLDVLRGPAPSTPFEIQFLKDRLAGNDYVPRSFFKGATPDNNYTYDEPLTITVEDNPYSYPEENWATLYLQSGGADSKRPVKFRLKPSTEQWFLSDQLGVFASIRIPKEADPWA